MFFIRHMAGRRLTREARAGRKVRRMGLILPDGRRIKRKGVRSTPLSIEDFFKYEDTVREWVMNGLAEVTDPDGNVLNWATIAQAMKEHSARSKKELVHEEPLEEPEGGETEPLEEPEVDEPEEASDEEEEVLTESDLKKMKRGELDKLAADFGLDPAEYKNAGQVIDAIMTEAAKAEEE